VFGVVYLTENNFSGFFVLCQTLLTIPILNDTKNFEHNSRIVRSIKSLKITTIDLGSLEGSVKSRFSSPSPVSTEKRSAFKISMIHIELQFTLIFGPMVVSVSLRYYIDSTSQAIGGRRLS
jgi:hypothetical protein